MKTRGRSDNGGEDMLQQYGVLPWRESRTGGIKVLLITSRRRGRWIVPKGWPVESKAPFISAALEAFEEAGIIGDVQSTPLTDYCYLKVMEDGSLQPCRVSLFSMNVRGTLTHWKEGHQRRRRWFGIPEAADLLDDVELAEFMRTLGTVPQKVTAVLNGCRPSASGDPLV